ncbi:MAG: hypothetical protein A2W26_08950 [Acidobacteria bacterium RBG_16_64_8]|nr:MAG: hypothetical protein A2W26_08950 [Acidobacteria bacterium RBG_16_64_8]
MRPLESLASKAHAWALFILARLVLVEIPIRYIEQHRGPSIGHTPLPDTPLDPMRAEFLWREQEAASSHTDSMFKQLLTLSSALATVVFTLLGGAQPWLRVPAIGGLLVSVLFCLQGLGVRRESAPDTPHVADPSGDQQWAEDIIAATRYNRGSHAHRVDLYRAAWRWFVLALVLAALAGLTRPAPTHLSGRRCSDWTESLTASSVGISHGIQVWKAVEVGRVAQMSS